jgi:hypothetical protein
MKTYVEGQKKELLARKMLEAEGYTILFKSQRVRFGKVDFGPPDILIGKTKVSRKVDIVGIHSTPLKLSPGSIITMKLISVKSTKSRSNFALHQQELEKYWGALTPGICVELWIYRKGQWRGRGAKKHFEPPNWEKIKIC